MVVEPHVLSVRARFIRFAVKRLACLCDERVLVSPRASTGIRAVLSEEQQRNENYIAERVIEKKSISTSVVFIPSIACAKLGETGKKVASDHAKLGAALIYSRRLPVSSHLHGKMYCKHSAISKNRALDSIYLEGLSGGTLNKKRRPDCSLFFILPVTS